MRAAGVPLSLGAGALCACALLFSGGVAEGSLVWIGAFALALAAAACVGVLAGRSPAPRASAPGTIFLGALVGLALWDGVSMLWSVSADASWAYANRTLVYAAFAVVGYLLAPSLRRPASTVAAGAAVLLGAVIAWALLAKCVPSLYPDYERLARLRSPVDYWNELALLADVAVLVGLWLAASRRAAGVLLVYGATLAVLLTYSRFGIALACLAAVAWTLLDRNRVASIAAIALGGGAGSAAFGVALALPGITNDHVSHAARAHGGWIFGLTALAGAALVLLVAPAVLSAQSRSGPERQRRVERAAAVVAAALAVAIVAVSVADAHRIWNDFANPVGAQVTNGAGHLASASSSNRWRWWQEAWHGFTRHPGGGTGAATFQFTDELLRSSPVAADEPHNTPLQFLSEDGIVGLLLYLAALGALAVCIVRRPREADERAAVTALGLALAAFAAHMLVDKDWNYVATCGPLLLVAGVLAGAPGERIPGRRIAPSLAAIVVALAAIYSLASPWLAQNELANAASVVAAKRAHAYDPLSTDAVLEWAAFEDADGHTARAETLYRKEVSLEPHNSSTWYDLGQFYASHGRWRPAYVALSNAWRLDKFGPAGIPCGLLDQARHRALGVWPPSCPGGRPASRP